MNNTNLVYIVFGIYFAINLGIGLYGIRRSSKNPEEYFLANRGVGAFVLFFTFIATNFSAFFFLGFAGAGYRFGYPFYAMMAFGTAFAALSFYIIGFRSWKLGKKKGYITPAEMIGDLSGSKILKVLYLLVMVGFTLPYLALQPIGAGYLVETLTGGAIPYMTGAIILTLFLVLYVFLGGMRSVAATDVVQGILMFIMMFLAVWIISDKLGGLRIANQSVMDINPDLFSRQGGEGHFTYKTWFSSMILWMLCVPMFPQMFMRFFIAKNAASFKISTILYAVIPLALFIGPVIIGVLGHLNYPNLEGNAPDKILPMLLMELVPIGITAIILVGAIAAFMSTLDSQLLALSTMITRDLYVGFFNPKLKFRAQVIFGKVMIVILAGVGLLLAANPPTAIYDLVKYAFTGYAVLFPTTVAVIYLKRKIPALSCIGSILLGEAFVLGSYLGWIPDSLLFGFDLILPVIIITLVPLIIGYVFRNSISN